MNYPWNILRPLISSVVIQFVIYLFEPMEFSLIETITCQMVRQWIITQYLINVHRTTWMIAFHFDSFINLRLIWQMVS